MTLINIWIILLKHGNRSLLVVVSCKVQLTTTAAVLDGMVSSYHPIKNSSPSLILHRIQLIADFRSWGSAVLAAPIWKVILGRIVKAPVGANIWYNSWVKCNDQIIITASEVHGFQKDYATYKLLYVDFNL